MGGRVRGNASGRRFDACARRLSSSTFINMVQKMKAFGIAPLSDEQAAQVKKIIIEYGDKGAAQHLGANARTVLRAAMGLGLQASVRAQIVSRLAVAA